MKPETIKHLTLGALFAIVFAFGVGVGFGLCAHSYKTPTPLSVEELQ